MRQELTVVENQVDEQGNPTGGRVSAAGIEINWQNGPLGRGDDRQAPNGAFVEGVIEAAVKRLGFFQAASDGRFACPENAEALEHLELALAALDKRTERREAAGTEGTHQPDGAVPAETAAGVEGADAPPAAPVETSPSREPE